jgi:thiosulfate/3-mercaptopyruvate sulfurtransferase
VNLPGTNGIPRTADGEMASPEEFTGVAGNLGIGHHGTIVVYDTPNQYMGLVAWAFLYYGHQDARLLDGGFEKWTREGCPVSTQSEKYSEVVFNAKPVDAIYCSLRHAKAAHGRPQSVFWDTRSLEEFHGAAPPVSASGRGSRTRRWKVKSQAWFPELRFRKKSHR